MNPRARVVYELPGCPKLSRALASTWVISSNFRTHISFFESLRFFFFGFLRLAEFHCWILVYRILGISNFCELPVRAFESLRSRDFRILGAFGWTFESVEFSPLCRACVQRRKRPQTSEWLVGTIISSIKTVGVVSPIVSSHRLVSTSIVRYIGTSSSVHFPLLTSQRRRIVDRRLALSLSLSWISRFPGYARGYYSNSIPPRAPPGATLVPP